VSGRWHQGCSAAYHEHLLTYDHAWRVGVKDMEHQLILGTDSCSVRGVCRGCGRSLIRGRITISDAVLGDRAPTIRDDFGDLDTLPDEWMNSRITLPGLPPPIEPGEVRR
jgi:hypothetical protein